MRIFVALLVAAPAAAYAQPAIAVDVNVRVDTPVVEDAVTPPSSVAPARSREPKQWLSIGYARSLTPSIDGDFYYSATTVRVDADVHSEGRWRFGVTLARATGDAVETTDMTTNVYVDRHGDVTDTSALVYAARAVRRGRFEARGAVGAGLLASATRWSTYNYPTTGPTYAPQGTTGTLAPIAELWGALGVDIYGPVSFAVAPIVTFRQESLHPIDAPDSRVQRGVDIAVNAALRWAL